MLTNKKKAVVQCPSCSKDMDIRELECAACNIQVRGHFGKGSRFDQLAPDHTSFLETFIRCRGVLRDVEAILGISYPTVRSRLDSLIAALGLSGEPPIKATSVDHSKSKSIERKEILAALDAGTMDAGAALDALNSLK